MKTCPECGDKIIGRADKKFCSDACRNAFNNKQNQDSSNYMRSINNKLRKNYRILSESNIDGKTKLSKQKLINSGFDFDYITQIITYKNGAQYYFVYEQGYKVLDENWILLVKKSEN